MSERGLIIKSTGSRYLVKTGEQTVECVVRGKLRLHDKRITNPVAVGDYVYYDKNQHPGLITEVEKRKNYLIRKATNLSKESHIIAANVDQVFLVVTLRAPQTLPVFIDRYLVTAEAYRIPAILLFNKMDLFDDEDMAVIDDFISIYTKAGYTCLKISALNKTGIDAIREKLKNKVSVFSGHSGVGKSSVIKAIDGNLNPRVNELSESFHKGKHTTTHYEMFEPECGGYIIDTPGIKGFGIIEMQKNEIYHFFPEIFKASKNCRYYNCLHVQEPGCAVLEAIEKEEISDSRYNSYLNILFNKDSKHR